MPLTKEQFIRARKAGFQSEDIKSFESEPLTKDMFALARKAGFSKEEIKDIKKPGVGERIGKVYQAFQNLPGIKQGDQLVENTAKFIEPNVPAGASNMDLALRLPQQMGAEFVRGYKPSQVIPFVGAAKLVKPITVPVAKKVWEVTPQPVKDFLLQNITVGKGLPEAFQRVLKKAKLEKDAGLREAEDVGKVLTTAPHDMKIKTPQGNEIVVKKDQPITREHQRYIGRIFRKEIDLGGKLPRIEEHPDLTRRINSNVEVEVAFNPKLKALNSELELVNQKLRDTETLAKGLVGKEFRTPTGFIEKATGVSKEPKMNKSGPSTKRFDVGLKSEPVSPDLPTASPIPEQIAGEGNVVRSVKDVSKLTSTSKFINQERNKLLSQSKAISKQIMKETMDIEEGVRANYFVFDRKYSEQIRSHPRYKELSAIADEGRQVMDKWSKALVESGIPKERASEIINENIGSYMARMYEKNLVKGFGGFSPKNLRLRLNGLKRRKELSQTVLNQLGEIKEPGFPTAVRVKEISQSIANNKIFKAVADNPEWSSTKNLTGDMVQMPKGDSLGALKGKFVTKEIASEINAITSIKEKNLALSLYEKSLSAWKFGKVVLNPATHVRNIMSNSMLLDLSGVSHLRQAQLTPQVFKDYINKGEIYNLAVKYGAIGDEFVGTEVALADKFYNHSQGSNLEKWMNVMKSPFTKAGNMYKAEEQITKLIKFTDELQKGKTPEIAALEAQKWLFNYNEIPNFIKVAKQFSPFITFTYKSVPRLAETLVNNPLKLYKYYALANAFNESSRKMQNMDPQEFARQEKALPPWLLKNIGGMPTNLMMPWRDQYGRSQWLNLEYILPVGMAPEILEKGLGGGLVSNPFVNLYADLAKNKDFKGKDIIPPGSTREEAAKITTEYIYRQLAPTLAPGLLDLKTGESVFKGGYSFEKIMSAIYKKPDYADRVRDISPAAFDVLMGLKLTPLDADESERFKLIDKKKMVEELTEQAMKLNHPGISQETREIETEKIFKKIQNVMKE